MGVGHHLGHRAAPLGRRPFEEAATEEGKRRLVLDPVVVDLPEGGGQRVLGELVEGVPEGGEVIEQQQVVVLLLAQVLDQPAVEGVVAVVAAGGGQGDQPGVWNT